MGLLTKSLTVFNESPFTPLVRQAAYLCVQNLTCSLFTKTDREHSKVDVLVKRGFVGRESES